MRMVDIIEKKRDGGKLTKEEIEFFVNGYVRGDIPDYQASALLMAIYFRNMDYDETLNLTLAMENSGDKLDLSGINGIKVDKVALEIRLHLFLHLWLQHLAAKLQR